LLRNKVYASRYSIESVGYLLITPFEKAGGKEKGKEIEFK
jgi:hypothetical protein